MQGNVGEVSQVFMHGGVLSIRGIQMLSSEHVGPVLSHHLSEQHHPEEVRVVVLGSLKEHTNIDIGHFVISNIHHRRGEVGFLSIGHMLVLATLW